ncbi:MAG TPA: ribosome small subunit-dependent GTPase A [Planctomycetota bacterium]|nr:ribosome small subunit-dependent GTPase A [Planctomycetota bacterium]
MPTGVVIRLDTASCIARCEGRDVRCAFPGKWRLSRRHQTRPIAVGDRVQLALQPTGEGVLEGIEPRRGGKLSRKAAGNRDVEQVVAANVDQLVIVAAAAKPPLNRGLLDRLAVSAEHGDLDAVVCLNKIDLAQPGEFEGLLAVYRRLGYTALATSAVRGEGLDELRHVLTDKISVFSGASGVGKSALLNAMQPGLKLRVGEVSAATGKGRHTTSAVSLLPLDFGGFVVDTPGVREFALYDLERDELQHCFPEMRERFGQCRFADCSHTHEPDCAVVAAVHAGGIDPARYESYCRIYESLPVPDPARPRR